MADSPSRRRSTPSRASSSSSSAALLVPLSIARPSMASRITPSKLFSHNNDNKENTSTPNSKIKNSTASNGMPYDAFMSPLKSAMKVYPVMSPLKKRRISFASPLRQCSPNASMRSHISERDEQDTTMTSATASVLDDLFLDDEQQLQHERGDRPEDARPQENKRLQQEDSQVTEAATQFSSQSCTASTATVNSPARITSENVTSDATAGSASKQSQISSSSMSSEGRSAVEECDGVEPPSLAEQVQRDALVTPPSEMTAIAANIPLPPSPIKAASTLTPPGKASPNKSHLINTVTRLAASIPLPASPAGSTSAAQQLQSRASPRPVAGSVHGTPLIDRTMQAALIALPQSVTRPSALSPSYPDSVRTHNGSQNAASAVQMMPFAAEAMVDSPVKMPSSLLHQLPFSRTNAIPSPLTHQPRANKQPSNAKLEAEGILPYAEADSVDSPVKHATVPNHKSTLRLMPFVNEEHIPSPTKKLAIAAELPPSNTEEGLGPDFGLEESRGSIGDSYPGDTDVIMDASLTAGATDEADALTSGFTSEAAEGHAQQSCDLNKAEESRNTVSDADSPLHANEAEPEMLVDPKASHAEIPGDYDVDNLDVKEAIQESSEPFSATPARPVMSITGQATPSAYASPSGTMGSTIHAPATKKRTLSRKPNDALRQDLSISSNSSLSETSAISSGEAGTEYESEERIMMLHQPHDTAPPAVQPSRGLKRKASASSVISVTQSSADQSVQESTRRITRQRSLTALKDDTRSEEKEEPSTTLPLVDSDASPASVPPKRKARDIKEDEQEARPKTGKTTSKLPAARTRRQSTRLASTSGLPQPTSRIGRKVATAKTSSTKPSVTRLVEGERAMKNQKNREEQDPLTSDEEEEHMPTVASRATLSTSENSQALTVDAPTPVPSVVRRPQRSARPARHTAIDAKPLPSPRRAVSPVKKPLRAARAINGATSSTDHDAKGKKATNNDRPNEIPSARVALRSPGRVLLSPAKTNVQPLRSPGRAFSSHAPRSPLQNGSATFDWSSVPPQGQVARLPQTLSPERYRTTASKIFGSASESSVGASSASSGPASSAASAKGLTAQSSPFKGLAQRLTITGSPSLLGLSVAPELLVLAPPSPSPTKLGDSLTATTASSGTGPSMLSASTSSAPESRRLSTPAQSASSALSTVSSPRRALSAQPTGAIPRDKLPSPRRVLPVMRNVAPTVASAGTPLRTASRVFPVLTSKVSLAAGTLAPLANTAATIQSGSGQQVLADDAPPRRSQRSARPQRAVQAIKKEASSASLGSTASAPNTKPAVTPAQVQALTNQNTSANRKLYNKHKVTVIHKDEERPPSPTSKIRKTGEHAPKDNKAVRTALAQAARGDQQPGESSPSLGEKRPHFSAAGDEGIYESPVKKMRLDAADLDDGHGKQRSKSLKWDRDLLKPTEKLYTPPGHGTGVATKLPPRPAVKNRALGLDSFGNVPDCKTSLSPIVPRTKVEISKIIYRDDDLDDDEE